MDKIGYATFGITNYAPTPHRIILLKVVNGVWKDYTNGIISDVLSTEDGIYEVMAKPTTVSNEFAKRISAFEDADLIFNDPNYLTMKEDLEIFVDENNIASYN
jgi:hypothetical protein